MMPFDPDKYIESKNTGFNPDDYLKKKGQKEPLEVGSEDGGPSPIQDQPLSSGYQRILKAGKIPENPFEKAALKQVAVDESGAIPYSGTIPKEQQPIKPASIYDLAVTDTENWYGAAPSPRKKIASFNEEAEVIKSRYDQLINSLGDPNNIDKLYDKEVSDLNKKYGIKFENGEYKFPDIEAKTDDEYNKQVPIYNEKIKQYNEEVGNINSRYKKNIADYNASIKRIGDYDKEIQDLAERLGLFIENGEVKVSQGEIDKYQEVYSRKLNERLSRISDAKKNPYIKDVITKLGSGSAGVLNMPYNAMALSEKAGNALLGLVGAEPSTYWQDFATYLNENKNELSQNAQRYEQDVLTMVGDGDMGGAIGKVGLDIAESLPMLATLVMGNAYGATLGNTTQVGITNTQAAIKARNANKVNLAFMGGGKSAEEYMSMNNRTDLSEFAKIVEALGVGVSEILFEQEGTIKILNGIRKGIQDRGENIVRSELKNMLQTNMQRNMSLLMRGNSDMMRESISEGMTQLTDNIIKKALVDPNIDIWDGVTDSMISGGLIGKGINLSLNAANNVQSKGTRKAVIEAIKQIPQNYSLEAKEKIATLKLEKQAIQDRTKDADKSIQEIVSPQIKAIDEEIKKIAAKEEGIELPKEEKPKEGEKKEPEATIPKSEVKVSPDGITSLKEDKPIEKPIEEKQVKEGLFIGEKVESTPSMKRILSTGEENVFTRPIEKDGVEFGEITIEEKPEGWQVKRVDINEEKKGYGKQVYRELNDQAQKEGKVIISDLPDKISGKAKYMWESLVKSNEAIKNEDGSYQMLPKKEEPIVEPKVKAFESDIKPLSGKAIYENGEILYPKDLEYAAQKMKSDFDYSAQEMGEDAGHDALLMAKAVLSGDTTPMEGETSVRIIKDGNTFSLRYDIDDFFNKSKDEKFNLLFDAANQLRRDGFNGELNIPELNFRGTFNEFLGEEVKPKLTEEPTDASRIRENAGPVQEGGNVRQEGQGEGGPNLEQQEPEQPGDEKAGLVKNIFDSREEFINLSQNNQDGKLDKQNQRSDSSGQVGGSKRVGTDSTKTLGKQPRYDNRASGKDARHTSVKEYSLSDNEASNLSSVNKSIKADKSFSEIDSADLFFDAISKSKENNPHSASVVVYPKEDYKKYRKFITDDGKAGLAIDDNGTIISVFSYGEGKGRVPQLIIQAIKEGANKLDHYDTALSDYYYRFGFVPVARVKWNDEYAVPDWDKSVYKEYNNGEPDVVLMAYHGGDPNTLSERYGKFGSFKDAIKNVPYVDTFEEGQKIQDDYVKKLGGNNKGKSEIEPEVAKKLRAVAGKIREGKISRIKGFQTNTPFGLAWDGGLEVLATTLEVTADLTVAVDKALTHIKNTDWYKNLTKEKQTEFDTKFVDHIENELGKEYRDATKYQFVNKEVGDRIQAATLSPKTFSEKAKEVFLDLRNKITRTYRDLPKNKKFAEAYNAISQFQKALDIASSKAGVNIRNILGNMQKADYDLFTYKIIFDDLAETIKLNPDYILPYALTPEALTQEIANINKFIGYNTKVQEAIKRRREAYKEIQGNYVEYAKKVGVNTEGYFERNDYFRHQVLLYSELSKSTVERKGGPLQRPKKLSLFKQRKQGKGYDINRNYIEAEFEVFNKLLYAIEKMKMIDNIYRNYDITKDLKAEAKKELGEDATPVQVNQWVEDNIPEGYVIDSPENMNIFMAQSIPESLVQDLMLGNVEEMGIKRDDLRKIFALGSPKKIIIPVELYKTMDNISQVKSSDSVSKATKKALTGWKIWSLIGPRRFIKYNLRNMSGDAEAVFLGNIRVFKKAWPAAKELYDVYFKKEPPTEMMNKYIERGGMQLVLTTQEIGDLKKIKEFEKVYDNKRNVFLKAWDAYWKTVKLASDFREQLLRYAAFKEWVSEIEKNNGEVKNYGASKPEFIDGLSDKYDKAFRLSNELLGAYDEIGEAGQNIRQYWIPFWSFQEVNFRRTNQIFMNSLSDKSFEGKTLKGLELLAKKTPFMALKATKLALKLSAFWGMTAVWNALLFGDEEDDLPEYVTSRPHIIFGRNADGTVRYLSRLGVMGDYLEWFGFDSMPMYISEYLAGRMTPREISKELMLSGANKLIGGANPYFKSFFELAILKKSLYPDFNNPRVIRNNGEYVAIALGIKDEYRAITKLPDKEYYKSLRKLFWDEIEPKEAAYWNIIGYKYKFKAKQKGGDDAKSSFAITDKSAALYYYKQSLLYGDAKSAEHYLDKYILLGGTKKGYNMSMGYLNPMRGISDKEKDEFMKFIGSKNKKEFDMAMEYYDKVVNSKMEWPNDKMDKENEGDEIPIEEIPQE